MECLPTFCEIFVCFLCAAILGYLLVCLTTPMASLPHLHCKESSLAKHLVDNCPQLRHHYRPTFWAANRHAQTILGALLPRCPEVVFRREYLQMRDRGLVALDWAELPGHKSFQRHSPLIIILPGLAGSALTMSNLCSLVLSRHFRCVVFNRRGQGRTPLVTPKLQSYGDTSDLRQAVKYLRVRYPHAKMSSIGTSAGAGLLVSYLGEYGSSSHLCAAVCVSPAYDTEKVTIPQPYNWLLLLTLRLTIFRYAAAFSPLVDLVALFASSSLEEFEYRLHGFPTLEDYWERNSPLRDVDDVSVPVLCVTSLDDPMCSKSHIPFDLFRIYPNLFLVTTERGGHCGFWEGAWPRPWAHILSLDYIEAVMDFTSSGDSDY